jgi:hypothetical protein
MRSALWITFIVPCSVGIRFSFMYSTSYRAYRIDSNQGMGFELLETSNIQITVYLDGCWLDLYRPTDVWEEPVALLMEASKYLSNSLHIISQQTLILNWNVPNAFWPLITVFMEFYQIQQTPWSGSASELYRPSNRRLSAKLVTYAGLFFRNYSINWFRKNIPA